MKRLIFLSILVTISTVLFAQKRDSNKHTGGIFIKDGSSLNVLSGKTINYYLNEKEIDALSKKVFKGGIDVSKEKVYSVLFDSLLACKSEVRPFYFYLFNELVEYSEGDLKEKVAEKCTQFVKLYPCDFFSYFNEPEVTINVVKWTTFIGMDLKDRNGYFEFKTTIDLKVKANCSDLQDLWKSFQREVRMCLGG